ncbi:MAG TPA: SDR family oxidoreductase [Rhizomicrobium sp.]|nr:SDR family oxidoreductase [Rhizomicrobium sp.]
MADFKAADLPSLTGKTIVISGTGGIGYESAFVLAGKGADIILAGRNAAKGAESLAKVKRVYPEARIVFEVLDLADLSSITAFAARMAASHDRIDTLVNNAAVMALPNRRATRDGFEMQLGTNHLGHFALTAQLLPLLRAAKAPRVTTVASTAARPSTRINFDDLNAERRYSAWGAYQQSKMANLLFMFELQRRSDANGWNILSDAAQPGYARTDLIANGPGIDSFFSRVTAAILRPIFSQSASDGALPIVFAAASPQAAKSGYYGPQGLFELKGPVGKSSVPPPAQDARVAAQLWAVSEKLTGVSFG